MTNVSEVWRLPVKESRHTHVLQIRNIWLNFPVFVTFKDLKIYLLIING